MRLCNFSNTSYHLNWYDKDWKNLERFLSANGLDGIELLLHGNKDIKAIPKDLVKGLHLSYFPTWLNFYRQDDYQKDFPNDEKLTQTFGGTEPSCIHQRFIEEFEIAKELNVEYMVYHVGHVTTEHAFTFDYDYTNIDVLNETLKIVNDVFNGEGPCLLFENLWWPGLTLKEPEEITEFMNQVTYHNKGIMLDLSHLMLTNDTDLDDIDYVIKTIEQLGDVKQWIKGIHINHTKGVYRMGLNHKETYERYKTSDTMEQYQIIYEHISAMDQHMPFLDKRLETIITCIDPKYKMIEVSGFEKETWEGKVIEQMKVLNAL